jgi:pantoate kinase
MKLFVSLALLTCVNGFAPSAFGVVRTKALTQMWERPDASKLIEAAMAASKEFGATSKEARLAWEAVEEVDASDNSAATKPGVEEECLTEESSSNECLEYSKKLSELEKLVKEQQPLLNSMQMMADELKSIKLATPTSRPAANSPQLKEALAAAKEVTDAKGITSSEARIAWETVEEIAAAGSSNAEGGSLSAEECLVDAAKEACIALEEFNRVLERVRETEGLSA